MAAELVPGYRIVHMIGQGGQAQVYLAERETDGLRVALKVLDSKLRHDRVFFERFLREYKLDRKSTRLNSSHLVISYAVFCLKKKNIEQIQQYSILTICTEH